MYIGYSRTMCQYANQPGADRPTFIFAHVTVLIKISLPFSVERFACRLGYPGVKTHEVISNPCADFGVKLGLPGLGNFVWGTRSNDKHFRTSSRSLKDHFIDLDHSHIGIVSL
jgi:hypothetical protein